MSSPDSPTTSAARSAFRSPPEPRLVMWARFTVLAAGTLLIVTSAFLPWIEVSIHRTFDPPTTISTYALWQLPVWGCFPFLVGLPLALLIWTLLQRQAGRRRMGRARLLLLCLAGAAGAVVFVLLAGYSADPFIPWRGVSSSETLLLGGWVCLVGYGMLVVGALLFG